jgi:hypothetical protein
MSYINKIEMSAFQEGRIESLPGGKNGQKGHYYDESRRDTPGGDTPTGLGEKDHPNSCRKATGDL